MTEKNLGKRGYFISFEGIDGSGKSTQLKLLRDFLEQKRIAYSFFREPGGTELGESVRKILLSASGKIEIGGAAELLLFCAARAQLVREKLIPLLNDGKLVICDRFCDSSTAYQLCGREIRETEASAALNFAVKGLMPDLTLVFDIPAEEALKRRGGRGKAEDRLESEGLDFMERVRRAYLRIAENEPERVKIIDGTANEASVFSTMMGILRSGNKIFGV